MRPYKHKMLIPLLVVAACAGYLAADFDLARFRESWRGFDLFYFGIAVLLACATITALGVRLHYLAAGQIGLACAGKAALLGLSLNVLLPAKLGEVAKIAFISDHRAGDLAGSTRLVFWERFMDLHLLLILVLVAITVGVPGELSFIALLVLVAVWAGLAILRRYTHWTLSLLRFVPVKSARDFARDLMLALVEGLSSRGLASSLIVSTLPWLVGAGQVLFVLVGVLGMELSPAQLLAVYLASVVGASVPLTPGALGVYEAAIVAALTQMGIAKEPALHAAIMLHTTLLLPVLFGAAWALGKSSTLLGERSRV